MQTISGGVCAPRGFSATGLHCGLKHKKHDLALIVSDAPCAAAGTYTQNIVKAAPLLISQRHLANGTARAFILNSGNANAAAPDGEENAIAMCVATAEGLGISPHDVVVASTGVIGVSMTPKMDLVKAGIAKACTQLEAGASGSQLASDAFMTTDLTRKEIAMSLSIDGKTVHLGAIAKGSGMIHPNMATLIACITTDAAISPECLQQALKHAVGRSFNRISVDGDTSTNDFCLILANGLAENPEITTQNADFDAFCTALTEICVYLAKEIAADGEGATHLITCTVENADTEEKAEILAKQVISSSLVKSAIFGRDANWGRVICAMGYSGVSFDPDRVSIVFESEAGILPVCTNGRGLSFDEDLALAVLTPHEIIIRVDLGAGSVNATCWGCDLTYDYVKINGEYRT